MHQLKACHSTLNSQVYSGEGSSRTICTPVLRGRARTLPRASYYQAVLTIYEITISKRNRTLGKPE